MMALTQLSYTSKKKFLMASSVAALVGLAPMDVDAREEGAVAAEPLLPTARPPLSPGVYAFAAEDGWWRRRNLVLAPVTKQET